LCVVIRRVQFGQSVTERAWYYALMLMRWLIDNYLRDAAQGKVREVVGDVLRTPRSQLGNEAPSTIDGSSDRRVIAVSAGAEGATGPEEFVPCEVAFVFALGIESGGLVDLLKGAETSRHKHGVEHAGKLAGREVVIVDGGVGQKAAARATAEAIKFYQPKWVISAGFAGGLTAELRRGHIVMAEEVVNLAGQSLTIDMSLDRQSLEGIKGLHVGRLVTVDSILREPEERRRLAEQCQAIACDMESFAVVEECKKRNVPCLVIRIVSDAVDDELPPEIEHLLKQKSLAGKLGAAAGAVMKRFSAAKDLWKMREDALKASDRLAKFLASVVAQLPSEKNVE
jgi:adenosylhomocysteine nucleosidase